MTFCFIKSQFNHHPDEEIFEYLLGQNHCSSREEGYWGQQVMSVLCKENAEQLRDFVPKKKQKAE